MMAFSFYFVRVTELIYVSLSVSSDRCMPVIWQKDTISRDATNL